MQKVALAIVGASLLGLTGCSDPYSPGQRALGGGAIGAGTGAAVGGLAGGGRGAAVGALGGGAIGAGTGALTTPSRPYSGYSDYGYNRSYSSPPSSYRGY